MSYDVTDLDALTALQSGAAFVDWSRRGGSAATNEATDRFLMRLAITTLNLEEMEMRDALPFPKKAREALGVMASYLHDLGYISEEAIERIEEKSKSHEQTAPHHGLQFDGDVVML